MGQVHKPKDLRTPTEGEKSLSIALMAFASGLSAGVLAFFGSLITRAEPWIIPIGMIELLLACGCFILSVYFGGRGIAYGPQHSGWRDNFSMQAGMGVFGILFGAAVVGTLLLNQEKSEISARLHALELLVEKQGSEAKNSTQLISKQMDNQQRDTRGILDDLKKSENDRSAQRDQLNTDLNGLGDRIGRLEAALADALRKH